MKYRYFIHHIISLVIFSSISISIDFLLDGYQENFLNKTSVQKVLEIIIILFEVLNYCYHKYMMDVLYHHYWNINTALGFFLLISLLSYSMASFEKFTKEFENVNGWFILLAFLINVVLGFATLLTRILTLDYHTPNHMLIAYNIMKLFIVLTQSENDNKWYSIILFVLEFFILMFYLEILEFNFCNLNKNTRRNIDLRTDEENLNKNDYDSAKDGSMLEYEGYLMVSKKSSLEIEMSSNGGSELSSKKNTFEVNSIY